MGVGRIRTDHHDDVGLLHGLEVLGAGTGSERLLQAVSSWRVAHACAGIDVVGAEGRPDHLLHHVDLFIGAAGGRDASDGVDAIGSLNTLQFRCGETNRLVPGDDLPFVVNGLSNHRFENTVLVAGITPSEASLHT